MAKCGVFEYEIIKQVKNNKTYKRYIYIFIVEFIYNDSTEYLQKAKVYLNRQKPVYFAEWESGYFVYLKKKKRELTKGVNQL